MGRSCGIALFISGHRFMAFLTKARYLKSCGSSRPPPIAKSAGPATSSIVWAMPTASRSWLVAIFVRACAGCAIMN